MSPAAARAHRAREVRVQDRRRRRSTWSRWLQEKIETCRAAGGSAFFVTLTQHREGPLLISPDVFLREVKRWRRRCARLLLGREGEAQLLTATSIERHKDGALHAHAVVYVYQFAYINPVRAKLEACWRRGFSHWRAITDSGEKQAAYVAKYATKDAGGAGMTFHGPTFEQAAETARRARAERLPLGREALGQRPVEGLSGR